MTRGFLSPPLAGPASKRRAKTQGWLTPGGCRVFLSYLAPAVAHARNMHLAQAKWTLAAHLPPLLMRTMQPSGLARARSLGVVRLVPWRGATHACFTGGTASPWSARAAPKR